MKNKDLSQEFKKVNKKLEIVNQEVRLASFDTTILASIFFVIGLYLSLIGLGTLNILKLNIYFLVGFFYILIPIISFITSILPYAQSIIFSKGRFSLKIDSLAYIWGNLAFVVAMWGLIGLSWLLDKSKIGQNLPKNVISNFVYGVVALIIILTVWFTIKKIRPSLIDYFKKNYPDLIKIKKKENKKTKNPLTWIYRMKIEDRVAPIKTKNSKDRTSVKEESQNLLYLICTLLVGFIILLFFNQLLASFLILAVSLITFIFYSGKVFQDPLLWKSNQKKIEVLASIIFGICIFGTFYVTYLGNRADIVPTEYLCPTQIDTGHTNINISLSNYGSISGLYNIILKGDGFKFYNSKKSEWEGGITDWRYVLGPKKDWDNSFTIKINKTGIVWYSIEIGSEKGIYPLQTCRYNETDMVNEKGHKIYRLIE